MLCERINVEHEIDLLLNYSSFKKIRIEVPI